MSQVLSTLLNAVTTTGAGTALDLSAIERYQGGEITVEISGTFVGTVAIEVSLDGTTWYTYVTATAPGLKTMIGTFHSIRGNVTAYTSGSITMKANYPMLQDLKTDIDTLLARLTAARAGYLDELDAANLPADVAGVLADIATMQTDLTAAKADITTLLSRLTAARAQNLDDVDNVNLTREVRYKRGI